MKRPILYTILIVFLLSLIFLSVNTGAVKISLWNILSGQLNSIEKDILFTIRLPRIFIAIIAGSILAICGGILQSLFRNQLVDGGVIGVSSGAALGAVISLIIGNQILVNTNLEILTPYLIQLFAFIGAIGVCGFVYLLSQKNGKTIVIYMLLLGIAINSFIGSVIGLLSYLSGQDKIISISFWLMGNLGLATWQEIVIVLSINIPALLLLFLQAKKLDLMVLGEDEAFFLGLNVNRTKNFIIILVSLMIASVISVTGIIGFVGLIVPHMVRLFSKRVNNHYMMVAGGLLGACLMLISDNIARTINSPGEIPIGVITGLLGGIAFIVLILLNLRYLGK